VVVVAIILGRFLPHIPIFSQMVLTPPGSVGTAGAPRLRPDFANEGHVPLEGDHGLIGHTGVAASILRPSGKAQIAGRFVDVVSEGPYIPQGSLIEVIQISGNRVVVRQV
jgi:membrane-bound serine protease (ClpP class)